MLPQVNNRIIQIQMCIHSLNIHEKLQKVVKLLKQMLFVTGRVHLTLEEVQK
jgi:hypothetical protein